MLHKYFNAVWLITLFVINSLPNDVQAGVIDPTSQLLKDTHASQLETWLAQGDLDWNSIWYGEAGASSVSWHTAVDNIGPTVSIYDVTYNNVNYLVGGYTDLNWSGNGWKGDSDGKVDSFIFNLTSNIQHTNTLSKWSSGAYLIYSKADRFATFGGGFDLFGGFNLLGNDMGSANYDNKSFSYRSGNIINSANNIAHFTINALETFTFAKAKPMPDSTTSVPEPTSLVLLAIGLLGIRFHTRSRC